MWGNHLMENAFGEEIPDKLYKYMTWPLGDNVNYTKHLIQNKMIHLQKPINFNDPFDCKIYVKGNLDKTKEDIEENIGASEFMNSLHRKDTWVSCFTTDPTNILMWSHYADKHTGICLEFHTISKEIIKVDYENEYPVFDLTVHNIDNFEKLSHKEILDVGKMFYARKSLLWEYEKEYRVVTPNTSNMIDGENFVLLKDFAEITGVICGCRMDDSTVSEVHEFLKNQGFNISVKRAQVKEKEYGLDII